MQLLLLLIITSTYLLCTPLEDTLTGSINYSYNYNKKYGNTHNTDSVLYGDYYHNNSKLTISPGFTTVSGPTHNNVVKSDVNEVNAFYVNELYYSYKIDQLVIAAGVFPFRKGNFYEYSYNGNKRGIGLYSITDNNMQGIVSTYTFDDENYIQFGNVSYEKYFVSNIDFSKTDNLLKFDSYTGSGYSFLYYIHEEDKLRTETQYMYVDQKLFGTSLMKTSLVNLGVSYNDETDTGRVYYGVISLSDTAGDNTFISPTGGPHVTDKMYFDKFETTGYYYLLGVKQELDNVIFNKDMVVGIEYMYRSPGYHTLLAGKPNSYFSYADIGTVYNAYVGIRQSKNTIYKLRYHRYISGGVSTKAGLSTEPTKAIEDNGDYSAIMLEWSYDFKLR